MKWFLVSGLILDIIGILLLGIDLIRFQMEIGNRAKVGSGLLEKMESKQEEIESWSREIAEQSDWIPERSYSRTHTEDEVSYNVRHALENLKDISSAVNGLAGHVVETTQLMYKSVEQDERLASSSLLFSIAGLTCLTIGFLLQLVGSIIL